MFMLLPHLPASLPCASEEDMNTETVRGCKAGGGRSLHLRTAITSCAATHQRHHGTKAKLFAKQPNNQPAQLLAQASLLQLTERTHHWQA